MKPIIRSLLENDLYKFSMGQAIYHQANDYHTLWTFKCRNENVEFTEEMADEINRQIDAFCKLRFRPDELEYLCSIPWINPLYVMNHLAYWQPNKQEINVICNPDLKSLYIQTSGSWLSTSMYEVPILAIVNEVYYRMKYNMHDLLKEFKKRADKKFNDVQDGVYRLPAFSEFGLRRRLCAEAQDYVVEKFSTLNEDEFGWCSPNKFIGTSNVYLAKKYGVKPVGTMAHEWIMCMGQGNHLYNPAYSNKVALEAWIKEYGVDNGIALTDTITTDCFMLDFDRTLATLFSGVRHDSGDPIEWGESMIKHYISLGIDPSTKTLLFSDSLDFDKADAIARHFGDTVKVAFGIGTYLSNDTCAEPLNIVMKVTNCNYWDVAKLSDCEGKGMCKNPDYVKYLKNAIKWRKKYAAVEVMCKGAEYTNVY